VSDTIDADDRTFTTQSEQWAFDQSLANEENVGMGATVVGNVILLVIVIGIILFVTSRKKSQSR